MTTPTKNPIKSPNIKTTILSMSIISLTLLLGNPIALKIPICFVLSIRTILNMLHITNVAANIGYNFCLSTYNVVFNSP